MDNRYELIAKIVSDIKQGSIEKYSDLYDATSGIIYFELKSAGVPDQDIEKLLQEVYVEISNGINSVSDNKTIYKWIKCLAYRKGIHFANSIRPVTSQPIPANIDLEENLNAPLTLPEDVMMNKKSQKLILTLLKSLPELQYKLILAYYFNESSEKDIADDFGISEELVKANILQARLAIQYQIEELKKVHGIPVYAIAPLPVFLLLFRADEKACEFPASIQKNRVLEPLNLKYGKSRDIPDATVVIKPETPEPAYVNSAVSTDSNISSNAVNSQTYDEEPRMPEMRKTKYDAAPVNTNMDTSNYTAGYNTGFSSNGYNSYPTNQFPGNSAPNYSSSDDDEKSGMKLGIIIGIIIFVVICLIAGIIFFMKAKNSDDDYDEEDDEKIEEIFDHNEDDEDKITVSENSDDDDEDEDGDIFPNKDYKLSENDLPSLFGESSTITFIEDSGEGYYTCKCEGEEKDFFISDDAKVELAYTPDDSTDFAYVIITGKEFKELEFGEEAEVEVKGHKLYNFKSSMSGSATIKDGEIIEFKQFAE